MTDRQKAEAMINIMKPEPHRVLKIVRQTRAEYTFRVEWPGVTRDGQFFMLSLPREGEAPISISGRGPGYVEFTIRKVGRLTEGVFGLEEGGLLYMRGPYGSHWPVEKLENENLIVVTSGTGLAPVRTSLMHFIEHPEARREVYLIAGFKDRHSTLFDEDREMFSQHFHTVYPLSREKEKLPGYETGRVTFFLKDIPDEVVSTANYIITGAPAVIASVTEEFLGRGAAPEKIWVSFERRMQCAVGKCGHCKMNGVYVCLEGPVFNFTQAREMFD